MGSTNPNEIICRLVLYVHFPRGRAQENEIVKLVESLKTAGKGKKASHYEDPLQIKSGDDGTSE